MGVTDLLQRYARDNEERVSLASQEIKKLPKELEKLASNMTMLTLSHNKITKLQEADLLPFQRLVSLNLFGNQLKELPAKLCELSNLEILIASNNKIKEMPQGIGSFAKLRVLDLSCNKLRSIRPHMCQLSTLKELYLADNKIGALPSDIGQLTQLETLSLRHNRLATLPPEFAKLTELKVLHLQDNDLDALCREIVMCRALKVLEIYGNPLPKAVFEAHKRGIQPLFVLLERADYAERVADGEKHRSSMPWAAGV